MNLNLNTKNERNERNLLSSDRTRYVELAIVNDPGMILEYNNDKDLLQERTISIVSTLQNYYLNTEWGSLIGSIQIVLSAIYYIDSFNNELVAPSLSCMPGNVAEPSLYNSNQPSTDYCEVSYANHLSNFQ